VTAFLRTLTPAVYAQRHARLLACDLATFVDVGGMRDLLVRVD
jgi:succinoglycan biosynthesis protein ExoL